MADGDDPDRVNGEWSMETRSALDMTENLYGKQVEKL
jgi:hypothetical protein